MTAKETLNDKKDPDISTSRTKAFLSTAKDYMEKNKLKKTEHINKRQKTQKNTDEKQQYVIFLF